MDTVTFAPSLFEFAFVGVSLSNEKCMGGVFKLITQWYLLTFALVKLLVFAALFNAPKMQLFCTCVVSMKWKVWVAVLACNPKVTGSSLATGRDCSSGEWITSSPPSIPRLRWDLEQGTKPPTAPGAPQHKWPGDFSVVCRSVFEFSLSFLADI